MIQIVTVVCSALLLSACATTVGARSPAAIPEDSVNVCAIQCEALGLEFDGLAIGDRHVDCICEGDTLPTTD